MINEKKAFIITGSIASGKSSVTQYISQSLPESELFNADKCVAQLWRQKATQDRIRASFNLENQQVSAENLKEVVIKKLIENPCKKKELEAILHPEVEQAWLSRYQAWMKDKNKNYFISEIPLLNSQDSSPYQGDIILVKIPPSLQIQRLKQRLSGKGIQSEDKQQSMIDFYLQAQQSWKYNQRQADYVIWNVQGAQFLKTQIDTIINHA